MVEEQAKKQHKASIMQGDGFKDAATIDEVII
jgi:hypothetical protein